MMQAKQGQKQVATTETSQAGNEHAGHGASSSGAGATADQASPAKKGGGHGMGGGCMMMKMKHGQSAKADGASSSSSSGPLGDDGAASVAFSAVSDKMHRNMTITYTGVADADFAKLMIAEHQAALDLARIALSFGKDAEVRKVAEAMIKVRESELEMLIAWSAKTQK
jgi:uncharacterized protein (DUF305 family)